MIPCEYVVGIIQQARS